MKFIKPSFSILTLFLIFGLAAQEANLVIPMGHAQKVNYIETSFDYKLLGSVDDSNIIHIWDTESQREIYQLNDHPAGIVNLDFHPSKNEMVSSDQDGNIYIWDANQFTIKKKISSGDESPLVKYLNDGKHILSAGEGKLILFDSNTGEQVVAKELTESVGEIAYSEFLGLLTIGTKKGSLIGYNPENLEETYRHVDAQKEITALACYADRPRAILGYEDGSVSIVNIEKDKLVKTVPLFKTTIGGIIVDSSTGEMIISGRDPESDVKILSSDLDEATKFKWSSERKDDKELKGLAWADDNFEVAYIADHANVIRIWKHKARDWDKGIFKGTARPIYDIDVDGTGEKLIIGSRHGQVKVFDLTGAKYPLLLEGNDDGVIQLDYHPDKNLVLAVDRNNELKIWNTVQNELKETVRKLEYPEFNIQFTSDRSFLRKTGMNTYESYNFKTNKKSELQVPAAFDMKVSPDAASVVFKKENELAIFNSYDLSSNGSIPIQNVQDFGFAGNQILTINNGKVAVYQSKVKAKEMDTKKVKDKIVGLANGDFVTFSSWGSRSQEYTAYHFNADGQLKTELTGHTYYITQVLEYNENLLTASLDGTIRIWNKKNGKFNNVGTFIPLRRDKFVITTPDQLFDASPEAMQEMHYTRGGEIIALEQLKETYYEPNLLPKLVGYGSGELRKPINISELGAAPGIELTKHPNKDGGILGFKVIDRGGGIGKVSLIINGKEVANDLTQTRSASAEKSIEYDVKGHPYLYDSKPSRISIKAYNKDASLGSEPKSLFVLPTSDQKVTEKPKIFALIIGTADYAEDEMDLTYAAKDATDFAAALRISSSNLIGGENLNLTLLTTDKPESEWPTKENIKKTFDRYSQEAKARDYLLVYMAGHGVNSGGEDGDFYYLTCTATDGKVFEEETREKHAISSYEFTEYIKSVPALNQVMIVDACHSGTLTSAFGKEKVSKTMSSEEVKAYERMKDRTGIFLLAGSAADAVSYETTLYGQGLLTYALLFGMKGAALHEGEYIDVLDLFQFAAKKVPQLAEDIGGIQRPEVRVPAEVESFNIGKMTDTDKSNIKLLSPKPVFVHTSFQDSKQFYDSEGIGNTVDSRLSKLSKQDSAPIIFMNENKFSGALVVRGRYEQKGALTIVDVKVFEDDKKKLEFKVDGVNANTIADRITARLMKMVEGGS
jgi:WD40 repeat protein